MKTTSVPLKDDGLDSGQFNPQNWTSVSVEEFSNNIEDPEIESRKENDPESYRFYHMQLAEIFRNNSNPDADLEDHKFKDCFIEYVKDVLNPESSLAGCPVKFDGISCWPKTPPGTLRSIPCFEEFNGIPYDSSNNATLFCHENGSWADRVSYDSCTSIDPEVAIPTGRSIKLIFYIGNSMSLVAVLLALWIFISFKDLRCLRNTIHTNLLATYLLHNLFWIASASFESHVGAFLSCSFYVALNYSTLTNFLWMFVEGLYLYILVVKTFSVENIKLRVYVLIGWGVAVPIVIAWLIVRLQLPSKEITPAEVEALVGTCWLFTEDTTDWIVKSPVLIVLTVNILFLVRIMWVLITKLRSANTVETQRYWKATKALLVLIPLLGLTYMLLIALPQELEHFRAVLLSTQGVWIALFYCFLNSEVRNSIRHHIERWRTERGIAHHREASVRHCRDTSPRDRTGRFSNYSRRIFGGKRESLCCSEVTTMTTFVTNGYNSQPNSIPHSGTSTSQSGTAILQVPSSSPPKPNSSQLSLNLLHLVRSRSPSPISGPVDHLSSIANQDKDVQDALL